MSPVSQGGEAVTWQAAWNAGAVLVSAGTLVAAGPGRCGETAGLLPRAAASLRPSA
ncbi:MAG: hypothetical protein U1F26_00910 [Lysobacterales bacterium]